MQKARALHGLVRKRRESRWPGYCGIGDFHGGVYECEYVSPYTKGGSNLDADIFVLLQDWSSVEHLRGNVDRDATDFGQTPSLPTNKNLASLLSRFLGVTLSETYATNLFPFIKPGPLSARIPTADLVRAAREFAIPQIEIVQPRLVVCLGLVTFQAVQRAAALPPSQNFSTAIASPFTLGAASIWCQSHPGGLGRANRNRGGVDRVSQDWLAMGRAYESSA